MQLQTAALSALLLSAAIGACASGPPPQPTSPAAAPAVQAPSTTTSPAKPAAPPAAPIDALGGRLFDRFVAAGDARGFEPDRASTKGVADGRGGPDGHGTLRLGTGAPLLNDAGHDYRMKNLFGWDLRGKHGIYGPAYMDKPYAVSKDLLAGKETREEVAALLAKGDAEIPAFGAVLTPEQLDAIAAFVVGVRDGALPHPDMVFELRKSSPGNYVLRPGGDATRGKALFAERCSGCHGDDGTGVLFDDGAYSLGSHARQKAYEDWLKIMNGQPGTGMKRQLRGATAQEMTGELLDLFAALCDRAAFPAGEATGGDVKDGYPRCGAYLK
jgi:mono/diheme cytochrome c family protein